MHTSPARLASLADQFLVAYACTAAVEASAAALFNVGHAAELYLKAVMCDLVPTCDVATYKHDLAALNGYWLPFFAQLRAHLRPRAVHLSQHLSEAPANPHMPQQAKAYLTAFA